MSRFCSCECSCFRKYSSSVSFLVLLDFLCRTECLQLWLHGVHGHSHLLQMWYYRWVRSGKDCIVLWQSLQLIALCLYALNYYVNVLYHLMMFFCRGWRYTADFLNRCCVSSFSCGCDYYPLVAVRLVEEHLVVVPCFEFGGFASPLSYIFVKHGRMIQKGDPLWHHHCVGNRLTSWMREFFPLFQFLYQLG